MRSVKHRTLSALHLSLSVPTSQFVCSRCCLLGMSRTWAQGHLREDTCGTTEECRHEETCSSVGSGWRTSAESSDIRFVLVSPSRQRRRASVWTGRKLLVPELLWSVNLSALNAGAGSRYHFLYPACQFPTGPGCYSCFPQYEINK